MTICGGNALFPAVLLADASDILQHLRDGRGRGYGAYLVGAVLFLALAIMLLVYLRRRRGPGGWQARQIEKNMESRLSRESDGDVPPGGVS